MKRIIATLLLIFISSLILNNFFAGINFTKVSTIKVKTEERDSTIVNVSKEKDTMLKPSKPIIIDNYPDKQHTASWYPTHKYPKVHREHPTAAYNLVPKGTWLLVKNVNTGDSCIVEVTDRNKMTKKHLLKNTVEGIDLSKKAFGALAKHSIGKIKVIVKRIIM